jgi:hypothetical protein
MGVSIGITVRSGGDSAGVLALIRPPESRLLNQPKVKETS